MLSEADILLRMVRCRILTFSEMQTNMELLVAVLLNVN